MGGKEKGFKGCFWDLPKFKMAVGGGGGGAVDSTEYMQL